MMYQPKIGDIGVTRISGGTGMAIRFGQWLNGGGFSDFEHVFVVSDFRQVVPEFPWVVEAMPGGARHVKKYSDPEHTVYLECPEQYRDGVAEAARSLVGTPYSFADYAAIALHRFRIPAPHLKKYIKSSGHMICSQLADEAALRGGWHLFSDNRWPGDVTPADLLSLVRNQNQKRLYRNL